MLHGEWLKKKGNSSFSENCLSLIINRSHAEHESTLSCCREKGKCQTDMQTESSSRKPKLNSFAVLSESLRPQLNTASSCGHQTSKIMSTNNRSFSAINENYKNNLWRHIESINKYSLSSEKKNTHGIMKVRKHSENNQKILILAKRKAIHVHCNQDNKEWVWRVLARPYRKPFWI